MAECAGVPMGASLRITSECCMYKSDVSEQTAVFLFAVEDCDKVSVRGRYLDAFSLTLPVELPETLEASYQLIMSQDILVINSVLLTMVRGRQAVEGNTCSPPGSLQVNVTSSFCV